MTLSRQEPLLGGHLLVGQEALARHSAPGGNDRLGKVDALTVTRAADARVLAHALQGLAAHRPHAGQLRRILRVHREGPRLVAAARGALVALADLCHQDVAKGHLDLDRAAATGNNV